MTPMTRVGKVNTNNWQQPSINDWVCHEHNMPLALLKGKAACVLYSEHLQRMRSRIPNTALRERVTPWIDAVTVERLWRMRERMFFPMETHDTLLRNKMVPLSGMTDEDNVIKPEFAEVVPRWNGDGLETPQRVYWHLFVDWESRHGYRLLGPTLADADAVNPHGTRPIRLGIALDVRADAEPTALAWAGGWATTAESGWEPSERLAHVTIASYLAEREMLRLNVVRDHAMRKEMRYASPIL